MFAFCSPRPAHRPPFKHIFLRDAADRHLLLSMVSRVFPVLDEALLCHLKSQRLIKGVLELFSGMTEVGQFTR